MWARWRASTATTGRWSPRPRSRRAGSNSRRCAPRPRGAMTDLSLARAAAPTTGAADQDYLRVDNLSKVYATRDGPVRALDQISLKARRGEFLTILGPSGCGKSTLLMIASG